MVRTISKIAVAALALLALAVFTPQAKASGADFECALSGCTGAVVQTGSNYSSTGVGIQALNAFNLPGFDTDEGGELFSLVFDTSANTITITDTSDNDATLVGTITSHSVMGGGTLLLLNVTWTVPGGFQSIESTVHLTLNGGSCANGCAVPSLDIGVTPTPEPASLLLMGSGLLGLGGAARRRWLK